MGKLVHNFNSEAFRIPTILGKETLQKLVSHAAVYYGPSHTEELFILN